MPLCAKKPKPAFAANKSAAGLLRAFWIAVAVVFAAHWPATAPSGSGQFMSFLPLAHAEEGDSARSSKKPRRVPHMQEATFRRLGEVQELMEEKQYQEALGMLQQMLESKRRYNNNERASIHRMLAFIYYEMEDNLNTIHHFEQVIAQVPDITEGMENTVLETLARLYFQEAMERVPGPQAGDDHNPAEAQPWFKKALDTIQDWMSKVDEVGPDAHNFIATVHYQQGNMPKAIEHMEIAVRLAQERGTKVQEQWWVLLQNLYAGEDKWDRVVEIGETLVKDFPKRVNWITLAGAYGETDQPEKQLWTLEAAHVGGYLSTETDFYTYAGLLLQNEMPNRSSKYLAQSMDAEQVERSVKNLRLLGQAYQIGRDVDEAIPVLEEAGRLSEDGETFGRLAGLYLQRDEYEKCRDAAQQALDKGGLRRPLDAKMTKGNCVFSLHKYSEATEIFREIGREARKSKDTQTEALLARDWLRYIDNERKRVEALANFD